MEPDFRLTAMLNNPSHRCVLVIDDNMDLAITTSLILRISGHTTQTAFNMRDGIEQARSLRPDVVILDMSLPDGDGYEVARSLREDLGLDETRIIGISACEPIRTTPGRTRSLFDDFLVKPVNMDHLLRILGAPVS
jgi:DNA-binding response OmpR family regulator